MFVVSPNYKWKILR